MKNRFLFAFVLMFAMIGSVFAQERTISGTVTSADDGMELPGVSVVVQGTMQGTITNVSGYYSFSVPASATHLEFSFVGMKSQIVSIVGLNTLDVVLEVHSEALDEVVVTALGISREKKALGYAVTEVGAAEIATVKETNVINSLAGRVSGVNITQSTSGPGGGTRVIIRGNNSITGNNQPLYVIDGIPMDNSGFGGANAGGTGEYSRTDAGTGISDINPDDVESITVLKGPNAAAMYGSRAANGVILITTKKGTSRDGVGVTFTSNVMFENPLLLPQFQNTYGQGGDGNMPNSYIDLEDFKTHGSSWGGEMDGSNQMYWVEDPLGSGNPTMKAYSSQPDNVKDFFRTGINAVNTIALEGGNDVANLRFSYTNNTANGIMENSGLKRNNFNLRASAKLSDLISVDSKITYFTQHSTNRAEQGTQGIMAYTYNIPRNAAIDDYRDYQNPVTYASVSHATLGRNPFWTLNHDVLEDTRTRMQGFVKVTLDLTDYLSFFVRTGTDLVSQNFEQIEQYGHWYSQEGYLNFRTNKINETNSDILLMFNKEVASGINLNVNLGANAMHNTYTAQGVSGYRFKIPTKPTTSSADEVNPSYTPLREKKIHSVYGSASLSYNNFVYLDITGRNDWSSTLPEDNWSYFYPSVSLAVLLNDFIDPDKNILDYLKVRGSWAQVGSDTGPYQLDLAYNLNATTTSYLGLTTLSRPSVKLNPDLKPERTSSLEFGVEFRMLNNRIYGDISYYDISSTDLIMDVDVSPSTGYDKYRLNVGEITNKGFEFMIGGTAIQSNSFSWDIALNMGHNKNTLVELTEGLESVTFTTTNSGIVTVNATVGGGYGDIYGTVWEKTDDGRYIVDATGRPQASSEKVLLGNYQPDWIGGLTNTFKYGDFTLNLLIDARFGGQLYSGSDAGLQGAGVALVTENRESRILDAVVNTGTVEVPVWEANTVEITGQQYHGAMSGIAETHIYDQTNIRLREASLMYTFDLNNNVVQDLTVGLVGRNLFFLYKKMDNFDPESSFSTSNYSQGVLWYNLPTTRSIGFNLSVRF